MGKKVNFSSLELMKAFVGEHADELKKQLLAQGIDVSEPRPFDQEELKVVRATLAKILGRTN